MRIVTIAIALLLSNACLEHRSGAPTDTSDPSSTSTLGPDTTDTSEPTEPDTSEPPDPFNCDIDVEYDDFNACTIDGCDPAIGIFHVPVDDPACIPECSRSGAFAPRDVPDSVLIGQPVKTYGTATVAGIRGYDGSELRLRGAELVIGRGYIVWGTARQMSLLDTGDVDDVAERVDTIDVSGSCFDAQLSPTHSFDAELTMESETLATFTLTFDAATDPPFLHVADVVAPEPSLLDTVAFGEQHIPFAEVDGGAFVTLVLPWKHGEPETENVRLYAGPDRLSGTVGPYFFLQTSDETLPMGRLTLKPR